MSNKMQSQLSRRAFLFGRDFSADKDGATAIEFSLISGIIGIVAVIGLRQFGMMTDRRLKCISKKVSGDPTGHHCETTGIKRDLDFYEKDIAEPAKR